jgi:hypothetical protein
MDRSGTITKGFAHMFGRCRLNLSRLTDWIMVHFCQLKSWGLNTPLFLAYFY